MKMYNLNSSNSPIKLVQVEEIVTARLHFHGLFEKFPSYRELEIKRYKPVICGRCNKQLAGNVVLRTLEKGRDYTFCKGCGEKLILSSVEILTRLPRKEKVRVTEHQDVARCRTLFETNLVRVKALLSDRDEEGKQPTCFISYARGIAEHERWVSKLSRDLRNSGIDVLFDRWYNTPATSIPRYIDKILSSEYVIVVGTPKLLEKYKAKKSDPVVAAELELINIRLMNPNQYGETVIPVLLAGAKETAFPPLLQCKSYISFLDESDYFINLITLIWSLFDLSFDSPVLEEIQESMSQQSLR